MKESGEMYLETILVLGKEKQPVRAIDVAGRMGLTKASVSRALTRLKDEKCIEVDEAGHIGFTAEGLDIAEKIYERHRVLTDMLVRLGVDRETAVADACKIEHDISDASFEAIKNYLGN